MQNFTKIYINFFCQNFSYENLHKKYEYLKFYLNTLQIGN